MRRSYGCLNRQYLNSFKFSFKLNLSGLFVTAISFPMLHTSIFHESCYIYLRKIQKYTR